MIVHTESGSIYELDLDNSTVQRLPSQGAAQLREDANAVPLLALRPPRVGEPMVMLIDVRSDGIETLRCTTPVINITD
jgi:hypothetical protein